MVSIPDEEYILNNLRNLLEELRSGPVSPDMLLAKQLM
jgi:hypothetical protein